MTARMWLALLAITACSKGGGKPAQSQSADTGMADMPGMAAATDVTLTAAQIAHGGVQWEPVATSAVAAVATVPGQVIPNEDRTARLGATVQGRVMAVRVRPGDRVRVGQILVTLQSPQAGMAQSDFDKARAQASYARSARERAERLLALKAIPQQDYDRSIADDELASAELRRAQSVADQIGATASASGEVAIRSPLNGVVLARPASSSPIQQVSGSRSTPPRISRRSSVSARSCASPCRPIRQSHSRRGSMPSAPGSIPPRAPSRFAGSFETKENGSSRRCWRVSRPQAARERRRPPSRTRRYNCSMVSPSSS